MISIYKKYSLEAIHKIIGGNLILIEAITKEWSKRKHSGIKYVDGTWLIPGGEILAIKNEMKERELEALGLK